MLRLEKVTGKNVWSILKLSVSQEQESFVAPNDVSIIEAYTAITGNGYAFPFGIYEDDIPVGFLMVGFDADDYIDDRQKLPEERVWKRSSQISIGIHKNLSMWQSGFLLVVL